MTGAAPDKLKAELGDNSCVFNNRRAAVVKHSRVAFNASYVVLQRGDASVEPVLKACFDQAQIHRVRDHHGVQREIVQVDGNVEALGHRQSHDLLETGHDATTLDVTADRRPLPRLGVIT